MHKLRSKATIRRFRLAAFLLWLNHVTILVALVFCVHLLLANHSEYSAMGLGLLLFLPVLTILRWIVSSRTNCPLCLTPVLGGKNCSKHRRARSFLGSHKIVVANSIILRNSFVCPYCHEPTALELRQNHPRVGADLRPPEKD